MTQTKPRLILDCRANVGEGPLWHAPTQRLWFTDIEGRGLHWVDPATGAHDRIARKGRVGGFTFERDGSMILFEEQDVIHRALDGRERRLATVTDGNPERFNDVKADPEGRVFVGTMGTKNGGGSLLRFDRGDQHTLLMEDVWCGNGPCFSPDQKRFYFSDSMQQKIYVFDYDRHIGHVRNRRLFVDVPKEEGLPDGATVDSEDHLWSTRWGGFQAVRYRPDGSVERRIKFPARQVSSITFGGPDYTDIYFTSASHGLDKAADDERGGGVFHLNLGIKGIPEPASRLVV